MIKNIYNKLNQLPERKIGLAILFITFILRAVYVIIVFYVNPPGGDYSDGSNIFLPATGDDLEYLNLVKLIIKNGHIFYSSVGHGYAGFIGPGLPWFLSLHC